MAAHARAGWVRWVAVGILAALVRALDPAMPTPRHSTCATCTERYHARLTRHDAEDRRSA